MGVGFYSLGCLLQQLPLILQVLPVCRHLFPQLHHPLHILSQPQCLSLQPSSPYTKPVSLLKCPHLRRFRGSCLYFPNFYIPPELIHHLPITSLPLCQLVLQPFAIQLLLLCPCFHQRKLVGIMRGQRANMLTYLFASVLHSVLGCNLRVLDYQPNLFCKLAGCRLKLHKVLTLGCEQVLGLLVEQKVLLLKQHIISLELA